jgi:hypothetical protein
MNPAIAADWTWFKKTWFKKAWLKNRRCIIVLPDVKAAARAVLIMGSLE